MPIRLNFKRTHRYNVSAKDLYVIPIYSLDNTCVEYTVSPTTTGRDALEYVAQRLDIEDTCFFGFRFEAWSDNQRWLFLNKPVKKQLDKYARQHALVLCIMLFIDNPQYLPSARLRRYFYLQLRQDVATGQLKLTSKQAIKLTAYSLQADHGDYVDFETTAMLWRERPAVAESALMGASELCNVEHVDDIIWGYCQLRGVSQDHAIWYYLDEIRRLSSYGVQIFYGSTSTEEAAELGVSRNGLTISTLCPTNPSIVKLKWEEIKDLAYSRKTFTIQLVKKAKSILFLFEDTQEARYLWNFCIQMHNSYIHYWSHVKAGSLQPIAHVSEPPDILRGTGLPLPNSASSPIGDLKIYRPNVCTAGESKTDGTEIPGTVCSAPNTVTGSMDSSHVVTPTSQLKERPNPLLASQAASLQPGSATHSEPGEMIVAAAGPPLPEDSGQAVNPAIGSDSEGGTLVGHWRMRSAADTMDSQMLGNHCVACLPVVVCLRNSTAGGGNGSKQTKVRHTNQKAKLTLTNTRSLPQPDERRRSHHHHSHHRARKHHIQRGEGTVLFRKKVISLKSSTPAEEAAARYNLSLTETSSGTSSESEFEADVCSTSAETSSSSNSSTSPRRSLSPTLPSNGLRRLLIHGSGVTSGATAAMRPMLASFGQHHYRLQQDRNRTKFSKHQSDGSGASASQPLGQRTNEIKPPTTEGHGWLASARRFTSALSESLSRRAVPSPVGGNVASSVGCHGNTNKFVPVFSTPQVMPRENTKSVGIAQVIRPEHSGSNNQQQQQSMTQQQLEGQSVAARKPCRPPMLPSKLTTNQRGASAGPGSSSSGVTHPSVPTVLHHSLYEAESRPQIRLQPPSPPQHNITNFSPEDQRHGKLDWKSNSDPAHTDVSSKPRTDSTSQSWHLVRHPVWADRVSATAAVAAINRTGAGASKSAEVTPSSGMPTQATASVTPFSAFFSLQTSENGTTGCLSAPDGAPDGFHISWGAGCGSSEVPLGNSTTTPVTSPEPSLAFTAELKGEQLLTPLQQMSSSVSSSSSSSSSVVAATRIFSNSSSPSSLASSFGGSPKLLLDKESSSSTMSYSACNEKNFRSPSREEQHQQPPTAAVVPQTPLRQQSRAQPLSRRLPALQQPRQRSLSGASSSGPLHLLTNSDIHQLLNLTRMRETALVHRLLAEYRQTLLLQQSLHANSVSTPNLTASQELRPIAVSPIAIEYARGEDRREGDRWQTSGVCCIQHRKPTKGGGMEPGDRLLQQANSLGSENEACQGCGCNNGGPSSSQMGSRSQNHDDHHQQHKHHEHQSSDFADYVNAAAFQCQRNTCHVASVLSTTDNDSNATFRVLSEVDARTSYSNNGGFSMSSTRASTKETSGVPFNHEDSGTTSDLMTISSGWKNSPRFLATGNTCLDSKVQQQQHTTSCFKSPARGAVKVDLPELVAGLPASPQSQYHQKPRHPHRKRLEKGREGDEAETLAMKVEEGRENEAEDAEEGEAESARNKRFSSSAFSSQSINETCKSVRSKIFAAPSAQQEDFSRVGFIRTSLSRSAFRDEYENLEMDSPPLSLTNLRSTTDVSTKSSASDGSFEDSALLTGDGGAGDLQQAKCHPRLYRRRRRPTATATPTAGTPRPTRPTRLFDRRFSEGNEHTTTRRVTLPHTSCDSSSHPNRGLPSPVQLCRQHLRALEHLSEVQKPREVKQRSPTPLVRRKKVCCHCRCHVPAPAARPASPRFTTHLPSKRPEKARSYDPFLPSSKIPSHHLSRPQQQRHHHHKQQGQQPQQQPRHQHQHRRTRYSVSPAGECLKDCRRHSSTRDLELRETTPETCAICCKRRCQLCDPMDSLRMVNYSDEQPSPISSSRVASDSSLTSIPAALKDVMVSSYEYEFPSQQVGRALNRAASSFDSLIAGPQRSVIERSGKLSTRSIMQQQQAVNAGGSHESLGRVCAVGGSSGGREIIYTEGRSGKPPILTKYCASSTSEMHAAVRRASRTGRRPCNLGLCAYQHEHTREEALKDQVTPRAIFAREPTAKCKSKLTSRTAHRDCACRASNDGSASSESPSSLGLHEDYPIVTNIGRPKTTYTSVSQRDGRYPHQQRTGLTALTSARRTIDYDEQSPEKKQQQHSVTPVLQQPPSPSPHVEAYLPPRAVRPLGGCNLQTETPELQQVPSSQLQRQRNPAGAGLLFTASMTFTPSSSAGCPPYHPAATPSPLADAGLVMKYRGGGCEYAGVLRESEAPVNELCQSWKPGVGTAVRPYGSAEFQSHGQLQGAGGTFQRVLSSKLLRSEQEEFPPGPKKVPTPSEPPLTNVWR